MNIQLHEKDLLQVQVNDFKNLPPPPEPISRTKWMAIGGVVGILGLIVLQSKLNIKNAGASFQFVF